jgi:ubiquinone/menaquinone biosynthesis C-methylase UbiE
MKGKEMGKSTMSFTNKDHLTGKSYKTQDKLNVRILTHQLYTQPQVDFIQWVLDKIEWRGDETAVDLGCGAGAYIEQGLSRCATYIAGDLSFGMVKELPQPGLSRLNLDIQHIPLADNTADVVLANHMLYHVPDKDMALAEIKRILRPGGRLVAATNSATNMAELIDLRRQAMQQIDLTIDPVLEKSPVAELFSLENGRSHLLPHFSHIQRHDLPSALVLPDPQPLLDYIASSRDWYETFLPNTVTWNDLYHQFQTLLADHFAQNPEYRVSKLTGVFICTP